MAKELNYKGVSPFNLNLSFDIMKILNILPALNIFSRLQKPAYFHPTHETCLFSPDSGNLHTFTRFPSVE